jgi:hypothetical protein
MAMFRCTQEMSTLNWKFSRWNVPFPRPFTLDNREIEGSVRVIGFTSVKESISVSS